MDTNGAGAGRWDTGLVEAYGTTATQGLAIGSSINVPADRVAVVVHKARVLDVLPPGAHTVGPASLPFLAAKAQMGPGQSEPLSAAVYLVRTERVDGVPWEGQVTIPPGRPQGLTYCTARGRASLQVADPGDYLALMLTWTTSVGQRGTAEQQRMLPTVTGAGPRGEALVRANVAQVANTLLPASLGQWVSEGTGKLKLSPAQLPGAQGQLREAGEAAVAEGLRSLGLKLLGFTLDAVDGPHRAPCTKCGSVTAPTTYAIFRRNISLFHVRFGATMAGNFCVPCALKQALSYGGTMLVCGWWGIIGMVLTPIYLVQNLYHLAAVLFGRKAPAFGPPQ